MKPTTTTTFPSMLRRLAAGLDRVVALGCALTLGCAIALAGPAAAVVLDDERRETVVLGDGTTVVLYAQAGRDPGETTSRYYYLPTNLRLAQKADGTPKFLFLKFTTDARTGNGGTSGGLLHFLTTWGLDADQTAETLAKLRESDPAAELKGPVPLEPDDEGGSYRIISATLSDDSLTPSVVASGRAPILPGDQAATAARLTADGAQLLAATFEERAAITDVSVNLNYSFTTLAPAARGVIEIDWSRIARESETLDAKFERRQTGRKTTARFIGFLGYISSKPTFSRSYDEMREEYAFLQEEEVIRVHFDQLQDGEATQQIQDAFFQFFLNMVAETAPPEDGVPPAPSEAEQDKTPNIRFGNSYTYKKSFFREATERKTQRLVLSARTAIRWPVSLTENLASWTEGLNAYPELITAVNLDDPFFQHRDIRFILDLDAEEIFRQAINYVTVNVRKERPSGRPFEDRITIDRAYLEENGVTAAVTYARGTGEDADGCEYQAQWSLRGGALYPADPPWRPCRWEGVTLAPPVAARDLEVEVDLDELAASGITRATVEVRYPRFGAEETTNIHLSTARGDSLVAERILTDRDAEGYVYRVILNHRRDGKLVLPWSARAGDDYIYVLIPDDVLEEGTEARQAAKDLGTTLPARGEDNVLDQFQQLLEGAGR